VVESVTSILIAFFYIRLDKMVVGLILCILYIPLAWVRKIEKFAFAFVVAIFLIAFSCIVITGFCIDKLVKEGPDPGFKPINYNTMWDVIGFSVYTYEGIGVVMPIMSTCSVPEKFPYLLTLAVLTLTVIYIAFSELCYYTFGDNLTEPIVM
jgi:proton-coupled amino acid transporter